MTRPPTYRNRRLAISDHAVKRLRQRAPFCAALDDERVRLMIADAVARGVLEDHYLPGQRRVRGAFLGTDLYVIIGRDETGWGRGGRAVVTVLTEWQVRESEEED